MYQKGVIAHQTFSVFFHPVTTSKRRINGEIVFGGVDAKHIIGDIKYAPITRRKEFGVASFFISFNLLFNQVYILRTIGQWIFKILE